MIYYKGMMLRDYFKIAIDRQASDLHLVAGAYAAIRVNGHLEKLSEFGLLENDFLMKEVSQLIVPDLWSSFIQSKEFDFSYEFFGKRFRINLHFQRSLIGVSARMISSLSPNPGQLGFADVMYDLTKMRDGLILVTGPSGSGKSTTLAAMINVINKERDSHIITIEDPIEYIFENDRSIIEQRELGADTHSFAAALKYSLRQDPNIIMVGEMRDPETIEAALTAAETGHLVFSTLHTVTAADTIFRIVDSFPPYQHQQVLNQLASSLRAIIAQQLLPRKRGGLVAAHEILINNQAVSNLIRRNQVSQIMSVIQTNAKEGMVSMNKSLERLVAEGIIDEAVGESRKRDTDTKAAYF